MLRNETGGPDSYCLPIGRGIIRDNYKTARSYLWKSRATMGKVMISLTDEAEELVRDEVDKLYYGRTHEREKVKVNLETDITSVEF